MAEKAEKAKTPAGWKDDSEEFACSWCKKKASFNWRMKDDKTDVTALEGTKLELMGPYSRKLTATCSTCATVNSTIVNLARPT